MSYNGDYYYDHHSYDSRRGGQSQSQHYNHEQQSGYDEQSYGRQRAYSSHGGGDYGDGSGPHTTGYDISRGYRECGSGDQSYWSSGRPPLDGGYGGGSYGVHSHGGLSGGYDDRFRSGYDNRKAHDGGNSYQNLSYGSHSYGSSSEGYDQSHGGYSGYGGSSSGDYRGNNGGSRYSNRSLGAEGGVTGRVGYGNSSHGGDGSHASTREESGYDARGGRGCEGGGGRFGSEGGDRFGSGGRRGERTPGVGKIYGCGYEKVGDTIMDPRKQELWAGRIDAVEVKVDDPDLLEESKICRRPGFGKDGRSIKVQVNCFGISLGAVPAEIFKYHVDVIRTPNPEEEAQPQQPPGRQLPHSIMRNVINAALRQYEAAFRGIRVAHDGMSALYSPSKFDWNARDFSDINPDSPSADCAPTSQRQPQSAGDVARDAPRRRFKGPRTFIVKMKLAESIKVSSLDAHYKNLKKM